MRTGSGAENQTLGERVFFCDFIIVYVSYSVYIHNTMKIAPQQLWKKQIAHLWPCWKGSLAKVSKPCIRPNCRLCRAGRKHTAWLLAYSEKGRRRCLYVPLAMVKTMERGRKNGRQLEKLLSRMGPALLNQHRQSLKTKQKSPPKN